jgi:hypothetical protein
VRPHFQVKLHNRLLQLTRKESKDLDNFWLGFCLYTISYIFIQTGHLNFKVLQGLQSIGLILIFVQYSKVARLKPINGYLKNIFSIYVIWQCLIVFRGMSFSYGFIKQIFFDASNGMMNYFAPLLLLLPRNLEAYKKVFRIIIIFAIFYLIYDISFIRELLSGDRNNIKNTAIVEYGFLLSITVCFLLLTSPYHNFKKNIFAFAVILISLFFGIFRARRGMILICLSQLFFCYYFYLNNARNKVLILTASGLIIFAAISYTKTAFLQNRENIFSFLLERGTKDTRTGVEEYFYNDLNTVDWIIGKGINGQYFCPDIDEDSISGYRRIIETGYLQIILNGGIISLVLILLITIPAIFKGLFYSRNILSKAAGAWVFLWVIYLYPATMQGFTLYYAVFWMAIGICYSSSIRNIPENKIKLFFLTKEPDLEIV